MAEQGGGKSYKTVRISEEMHKASKIAAIEAGSTLEQFVEEALKNKIGVLHQGTLPVPRAERHSPMDESEFGVSFLESLPVPAIIMSWPDRYSARETGTVLWCNRACELMIDGDLKVLKGKPISSRIKFTNEQDAMALRRARYKAAIKLQHFTVDGKKGAVLAEGFPIKINDGHQVLTGDLSFPAAEVNVAATKGKCELPVILPSDWTEPEPLLCSAFVRDLRVAAALKDSKHRLCWYNEAFRALARLKNLSDGLNKTSMQLFNLQPSDPTPKYDSLALEKGEAHIIREDILGQIRTSVHFPVFSQNGSIDYVGVVSFNPPKIRLRRKDHNS